MMNRIVRKTIIGIAFALFSASMVTSGFAAGAATQPSICSRSCWGSRSTGTPTEMSALNRAIIHHTAGSGDYNVSTQSQSAAKVRAVQNIHMDNNGWSDLGYHFLFDKLGNSFEGRRNSLNTSKRPRGSHDGANTNSFGFSNLGYYHTPHNNTLTAAQKDMLYDVIAWRMPNGWSPYGAGSYNGKTVGYLDGHRDVKATACPGDIIYNGIIGTNHNAGEARNEVWNRINTAQVPKRVDMARTSSGNGYWIADQNGGVYSFGNAAFHGSLPGIGVSNTGVVGIVARPQGDGYWLVDKNGAVFSFGAAPFHGSLPGIGVGTSNVVAMGVTSSGNGYWIFTSEGSVYTFGDAPFHGSLPGMGIGVSNIKSIATTPGNGYWMMGSNGAVYSFSASFYGSATGTGSDFSDMLPSSSGTGYWLVRSGCGCIYSYNVNYHGGHDPVSPVVALTRATTDGGYWTMSEDGAVYSFGNAQYYGGANF